MKPLTYAGLFTAILLTAVSLYAVEDIPAFGDENSAANKYIKLFAIDAEAGLAEKLNAGTLPEEIKNNIYDFGFIKGPTCEGCQDENYPALEEGNYKIEYIEKALGWGEGSTRKEDGMSSSMKGKYSTMNRSNIIS